MLATTIIDPLLSSPTQVQRHDDDMAVTFPSSSLVLDHQDDVQLVDSLTYSTTSSSENDREQQEEGAIEETTTDEEDETPFEQLMNRGNYLRQLRALALQDEMERRASSLLEEEEKKQDDEYDSGIRSYDNHDECGPLHGRFVSPNVSSCAVSVSCDEKELCDRVTTITTTTTTTGANSGKKVKVLDYNSYLAHQRYYDDLKHVDITFMDYGVIPHRSLTTTSNDNVNEQSTLEEGNSENNGGRVVIEQRKHLGKGGFCWDAAFVLAEHVIAHEHDWNVLSKSDGGGGASVLELGAGTGLCGIMVGKATNSHVTITDLPELEELMGDNVRRNFGPTSSVDEEKLSAEERSLLTYLDGDKAKGTVTSRVLRWGVEEDYFLNNNSDDKQQGEDEQTYDVIIGADIVASLYDPIALAQTLHALCGPTTKIYISSKSRLDKPHETFDVEMARLFERVEKKVLPRSRLNNPNVFIIQAEGKRDLEC